MPIVKLFANLRKLAGWKESSVAGSTIGVVLNELIQRQPALVEAILEHERLRPQVLVMLNGHTVSALNVQVNEQDVIAIFPPIAGG